MSKEKNAFEEMEELYKLITYHAHVYHVLNKEEISNHEYDQLEERWGVLSAEHPEIAELFDFHDKPVPIHDPSGEELVPFKLDTVMLSLAKALSLEGIEAFYKRFPTDTSYYYEVKLDGIALEVTYIKGVLSSIVTRGSGMVGEDITHNEYLFKPDTFKLIGGGVGLPDVFKVRGEAFFGVSEFNAFNEVSEKKKANPRSAVSGLLRSGKGNKDSNAEGTVDFAVYYANDDLGCSTYEEFVGELFKLGFMTPGKASHEAIVGNIKANSVPTDGIVVKVNDLALQRKAGVNSKHPRWAIAYKYPPEESFPTLINIEWNTSRTGRVVPVSTYTPVKMGGTICTRASLDNYKSFLMLGLREKTVISVTRNNDVIPRLNRVVELGKGPLFKAPTECPSCSSVLEVKAGKETADLICNNVSGCPAQLLMRCVAFVDKFGLKIDGLGPITLNEFIERDMIKRPVDILKLGKFGLTPNKTVVSIQKAMNQPLHRVIKAACISQVGVVLAKRIANAMPAIDKNVDLKVSDHILKTMLSSGFLTSLKGVSAGIYTKIVSCLSNENVLNNFVDMLETIDIDFTKTPENELRVCVTGSLGLPRNELGDYFADHEIELVDKLTKDCKFILVGEKPSKSKLLKATELSIPMLKSTDYSSIDKIITFMVGNKNV